MAYTCKRYDLSDSDWEIGADFFLCIGLSDAKRQMLIWLTVGTLLRSIARRQLGWLKGINADDSLLNV
ncbi:MAG: hypothetical protein DI560_05795 [Pseudomonas putida]|nr:MAG: hypothetical protein DI560_05795 [Pseudomonas putida]